jgi:predicted nucleic acid-binding protein
MTDKIFVDTNILVYAHDTESRDKHAVARDVLRELWHEGAGIISPQVLQEFYVTVTRKIAIPLPKQDARLVVDTYAPWCTLVSSTEILLAFRIEEQASLSFWDSLIVASASSAGATKLLSEDLNAGQTIAGVTIENPFLTRR